MTRSRFPLATVLALLAAAATAATALTLPAVVLAPIAAVAAAAAVGFVAIAVRGRSSVEDAVETVSAEVARVEESARDQRRGHAAVMGRLGAGVATFDATGTVTAANEFLLAMLGMSATDVVGRDMSSPMWSPSSPGEFEQARAAVADGGVVAVEWTLMRASGQRFEAQVVMAALPSGDLVATVADASRDRALERSLAQERDHATAAADLAAEDLNRVRAQTTELSADVAEAQEALAASERSASIARARAEVAATVTSTDAAEDRARIALEAVAEHVGAETGAVYLGAPSSSLVARVGRMVVPDGLESADESAAVRAMASGKAVWATNGDAVLSGGDDAGSDGWELHVPLVAGSRSVGVISLAAASGPPVDASEITELAGDVARALSSRARGDGTVDDALLGLVSREMRTPLTSVAGYLQDAVEEMSLRPDDDGYALLNAASRNAHRLEALVDDLTTLSEIGRRNAPAEAFELSELVSEICAEVAPEAQRLGVELVLQIGGSVPVAGDDLTLERAVSNLVSNALRFTPAGGRVDVSVAVRDGRAVVEVADNGLEIADEDLGDLFEPDRPGPVSSRASLGAGFGLAVVKAVVDAHDGTVSAASRQGDGMSFRIEFPAANSADRAGPSPASLAV